MKVKEIYVGANKSWNFQSYKAEMKIELDESEMDNYNEILREFQSRCRKAVNEQIAIDKGKLK